MYVFVRSPPLALENSQRQHLMHNNVIRLRSSLFLFQAAYKWRIPKNTNRPIASHDDVTQERRYFVALFAFYETITRRYHPGKVTQRKRPLWIVADKANLRYSEYSDKKDVFFFVDWDERFVFHCLLMLYWFLVKVVRKFDILLAFYARARLPRL